MSFIGQFPVRLDAKNRAFMPAGFRRILQQSGCQTLVVRKDYFENCLVVYPAAQWQEEIAGVRAKLNRFDGNQQMVYRKLVSEAQEVQLDSNGCCCLKPCSTRPALSRTHCLWEWSRP